MLLPCGFYLHRLKRRRHGDAREEEGALGNCSRTDGEAESPAKSTRRAQSSGIMQSGRKSRKSAQRLQGSGRRRRKILRKAFSAAEADHFNEKRRPGKSRGVLRPSARRESNPRPSPWQGDVVPLYYSRILESKSFSETAQNRNRTSDTRIFSPLLYRLSYLGKSG